MWCEHTGCLPGCLAWPFLQFLVKGVRGLSCRERHRREMNREAGKEAFSPGGEACVWTPRPSPSLLACGSLGPGCPLAPSSGWMLGCGVRGAASTGVSCRAPGAETSLHPWVAWISRALVCLCSRDSIRHSSFTGCRLRSCGSGAGAPLGGAMCVPARHVAVIPGAAVRTLSLLLRSQPENTSQSAAVLPALAQPPQEGGRCLREQFRNALSNTCLHCWVHRWRAGRA